MIKALIDTNVCLDLLCARTPFNSAAEKLFSLADKGEVRLFISALSFANMDYILKSQYKMSEGRNVLARFKVLVTVLSLNDKIIDLVIGSDFSDLEDGIQYYTAIQNDLNVIVTRDLKGFQKAADIRVISPEGFLESLLT